MKQENNNFIITDEDYDVDEIAIQQEDIDNSSNDYKNNNKKDCSNTKNNNTNLNTKTNLLYNLLSRDCGATIEELEQTLGWKKTSIRGALSNMQKQSKFTLFTLDIRKSNYSKTETYYFIKELDYSIDKFF